MFTKEQLVEAIKYFTVQAEDKAMENADSKKALEISTYVAGMTSVCSTGKREVAGLLTLITGLPINYRFATKKDSPYTLKYHPVSKSTVLVGSSGDILFFSTGATISHSAWLHNTEIASLPIINNFCTEVYTRLEAYDLSKSFVEHLMKLVEAHQSAVTVSK